MHDLIKVRDNIISYFYYNNSMQGLSFHRKHFSHSIKRLLPNHPPISNPESPSRPQAQNLNPLKSPRRCQRHSSTRKENSYEKMVDDVMKRHVQEQQIPLQMTKLLIRHDYKNYRIINSGKNEQPHQKVKNAKSHEVSPSRNAAMSRLWTEQKQLKQEIIQSFLEKKRKTKAAPLQLPLILKYNPDLLLKTPSSNKSSILTHKSSQSAVQLQGFEDMKRKFIKKYVKSYTEA